ncbi:MAG: C_GCAxxG_C_C family protein [Desulfobacterales bacterium]|nr:C_GCAxxG_C_C family protein [Desulfobacterales bacterium]
MNKSDQAVACFKEGFACSQAILSVYGQELGLDRRTAMKIAQGFVGGMARMGETCGAVTGAIMVIGLKYGQTEKEDAASKFKTIERVNEFVSRFKSGNGSIACRNILGCEIDTPEKSKAARDKGLFDTICPRAIRQAAEILEEIL